MMVWSDYKNEKLTDTMSLRYLMRFTLVDVASGNGLPGHPLIMSRELFSPKLIKKAQMAPKSLSKKSLS